MKGKCVKIKVRSTTKCCRIPNKQGISFFFQGFFHENKIKAKKNARVYVYYTCTCNYRGFFSFFYWEGGLIGHVQAEYLLIYLDISDFIKDINTSKADSKHWSYYTYKVLNERTNLYFFRFFFSPKTTSTRLLINSDAEIGYIDSDFLTSVNKQNKLGQISHVVKTPLSPHWYIGKGRFVFQQALGLGSLYKLFAISEEKEINLGL